jgi:tetratricopeptide (TPR) repeat protein
MKEKIKQIDKERIKKAIDETFNVDPKNVKELWQKGFLLTKRKKYDEAKKCLDEALKINPRDQNALKQMGNLLRILGKYEDALEYYNEVLEMNPKEKLSLWMKIYCLEELIKPCLNKNNPGEKCLSLVKQIKECRESLKKYLIEENPNLKSYLEK